MTDSDSSDDENLKKLLEATDATFLYDSLYQKKEGHNVNSIEKQETLPSLRRNKDDGEEDYNVLKLTAGFRDYVAKQLDKRLAASVKYSKKVKTESEVKIKKMKNKRDSEGGVKLLRDSVQSLTVIEGFSDSVNKIDSNGIKFNKPILKRRILDCDNYSEEEKIKSVALSPETILNQTGTEHWTCKNKVFRYKKNKMGSLVSID